MDLRGVQKPGLIEYDHGWGKGEKEKDTLRMISRI